MNLPQRARIACDMTQREFAKVLGTCQSVINRWESGETTPSQPVRRLLRLLVEHQDVVPDWLVELSDHASGRPRSP